MRVTADTPRAPRLLELVRAPIHFKHYSIRTEQAYVEWVRRYIRFHGNRHPSELGVSHLESFLTHLAAELSVAASTQNQAQSALLFLYRKVLGRDLPWLDNVVRAKAPTRLPVVLTRGEVTRLLGSLRARIAFSANWFTAPDCESWKRLGCA